MWIAVPSRADARGALITSWVVLGFMVVQVLMSLSFQVDAALAGTRRTAGVTLAVASALCFLRLQTLILRGSRPRYFPGLRWGLIAIGILLFPLADAWAIFGMSLATLFLTSTKRQVLLLGLTVTIVVEFALADSASNLVSMIGVPMYSWLAGGVIFVLTRLCVVIEELQAAREHIARLRIDKERHRIFRDLHDILGRTLVAGSLRTQTALRLLDDDPAACRKQLEQAAQTLADGQAQLRALVGGAVIIGLDSEIATALDLFDRIGVDCEVDADAVPSEHNGQLAAAVLREAVTNMLKHSRPLRAWISVDDESGATLINVVNDGAPMPAPEGSGTGLRELARTIEQSGGTLEAGEADGARFRVSARILHEPASQGAP